MLYQVICPDCGLKLVEIDKPQILQEDIDMYKQGSSCQICSNNSSKLKSVKSFTNKMLRNMKLRKR